MKEIFNRHENGDGGWVIDFKYLQAIREDIEREDGDLLHAEDIEQVLCAIERVGIPSKIDASIADLEERNAELVAENERLRCCGNCANDDCAGGFDWSDKMEVNTDCTNNNFKHWQRKEKR